MGCVIREICSGWWCGDMIIHRQHICWKMQEEEEITACWLLPLDLWVPEILIQELNTGQQIAFRYKNGLTPFDVDVDGARREIHRKSSGW